jgi:hypothetical protein
LVTGVEYTSDMVFNNTIRMAGSLGAVVALSAGISTSAYAAPLSVQTTIAPSCIVNSGSLAALTPIYSGPSNVSVGSATTLNTTCNTTTPTVAFPTPRARGPSLS